MTTTTLVSQNAISTLIEKGKEELAALFNGPKSLLSFSGSIVLEDGKLFITTSESIGPASFSTPRIEIDPAAAWHFCTVGVGGVIGKLFGKKQ